MEKNITSITNRGECLDTLGGKACTFVVYYRIAGYFRGVYISRIAN